MLKQFFKKFYRTICKWGKKIMSACKAKTFKHGDKVKVVNNTSGHNIPIGTVVTLNTPQSNLGWYPLGYSVYMNWADFVLLEDDPITKECLEKQLKKLQCQARRVTSQIQFMEETKTETFCENEWKVHETLKALENKELTHSDRVKAIAKLLS